MQTETIAWPGWPYFVSVYGIRAFCQCFLNLKIRGEENVPATGPAMLLANHESYFDPYMVTFLTTRPVTFMAKTELFEGFGGWLYPRLNTQPVRRGQADLRAFRNAAGVLARGELMGIFPEGTRSPDGKLQPPQPGGVSIAMKAQVPIIPVAIAGTFQVLPRHGGFRRGTVAVVAGRPIRYALAPDAYRNKQLVEEISRRVMAEIAELRRTLQRDFGAGVYEPAPDGEEHGAE